MFFTKGIMRKTNGMTLVEVITTLSIFSIVMSLIITTCSVWMKNYKYDMGYSKGIVEISEALMCIDYHVNYKGTGCYRSGNKLVLTSNNGGSDDYVELDGNKLMIYYKNDGSGYQPQPLLYGVKEFSVKENGKVVFVKIVNEDGIVGEKSIGKI
ncbi:MAG: prepilin-type N-terminal cleavage/methylation domain-containing protein [Clostridium sp.]|uniref:prepilin-type N-terminal cleavage/methylation domain-containing protein n=1 Tax=Clostridium sp. TaxID=1506 RepID=UPI003020096A